MEGTLTDCLVRVREDLSQLIKVRDYLDTNVDTEEPCSVTWRTIEAFNSILSVCSSQNTPETDALDTLLDSFYYLARNNRDDSVWDDFGFELGIICVKVLSAIERTDIFEILFCKLLSVISLISEYNSNVWKAAGRQILNVLINKKVSLSYLEAILKLYISILKNIESSTLHDFSSQNLHLLKTLSLLVQKVGDFEIQSDIIELIFLHLSKETKLMSDFFSPAQKNLFQSLQFTDFENDCRLYLNALNKSQGGFERKVYSICCFVLYLGGCFVEPAVGKNSIWVDANKDSERLSIKCENVESTGNRVIYIQFSEILNIQLENDKAEGNRCLTIQVKTLKAVQKDVRNDSICIVAENGEEVFEFIHFLEAVINEEKRKKKFGGKGSKTTECLFIDRNRPRQEVQSSAVAGPDRQGIDRAFPDVLSLFERTNQAKTVKTPPKASQPISQELSPNSFVESWNKNLGLVSPEPRHTFEDSVETIEFLQKSIPGTHKLFRSPDKMFNLPEEQEYNFNFIFKENKENDPPKKVEPKLKTYSRKPRNLKSTNKPLKVKVPGNQKNCEVKLSNNQSQDCFQDGQKALKKKKPSFPKIKRSTKSNKNQKQAQEQGESKQNTVESKLPFPSNKSQQKRHEKENNSKIKQKTQKEEQKDYELKVQQENQKPGTLKANQFQNQNGLQLRNEIEKKQKEKENGTKPSSNRNSERQQTNRKKEEGGQPKHTTATNPNTKPSLLDPNGYAFQRWCQPTTSERSNFWLKKLSAMQKPKTESDSVFDFSDDSIFGENKRKKRVVRSKPRCRNTKSHQTTLRQVKEIMKKSPMKVKPKAIPRTNKPEKAPSSPLPPPRNEKPAKPLAEVLPDPPEANNRRSWSPEILNEEATADEDSEYESVSDENDEPVPRTKKRERSDEDTSSWRRGTKKKRKTALPKNLLIAFRRRLQTVQEKDRQTTNEIIQTITKATSHLFNHLHRKNGEKVVSYLTTAETASNVFAAEGEDLSLRASRVQRAVFYFKAGCSIANSCESLLDEFSKIRIGLKELRETKNALTVIDRISTRLIDLINTEIDRLTQNEWESKRRKLLRCASILGIDLGNFDRFEL